MRSCMMTLVGCLALAVSAATTPDWLAKGVVAEVAVPSNDFAKAAAKLSSLGKAGVTVVSLKESDVPTSFVDAAKSAGLKVLASYRVARGEGEAQSAWEFYGVERSWTWNKVYEDLFYPSVLVSSHPQGGQGR